MPICENTHYIRIGHHELWESSIYQLTCPENKTVMGYIGDEKEIMTIVTEEAHDPDSIINDEGFSDYFKSPEIMYQVMKKLHAIADRGDLYCSCGHTDIDVEVYPDRLELHCAACHGLTIVYAENAEDLQAITEANVIELIEKVLPVSIPVPDHVMVATEERRTLLTIRERHKWRYCFINIPALF